MSSNGKGSQADVGVEYGVTTKIKDFAEAMGKARAGEAERATEMPHTAHAGNTANHALRAKSLHLP